MPLPSAGRPATEKDYFSAVNGDPIFLGALVSSGTVVDNSTTATPFNTTPLGPPIVAPTVTFSPTGNLANTLAGKVLLLQSTAAGSLITAGSRLTDTPAPLRLAQQSVQPPVAGTTCGPALASGDRVLVTMLPTDGWLQWLPTSGSGNLLVWEMR